MSDLTGEKNLAKIKITVSKIKRRLLKHVWLVRIILIGLIASLFILSTLLTIKIISRTPIATLARYANNFIFTPNERIFQVEGRTNILVMGKSGSNFDSPDLTDSLVVVSVSHKNKKITTISLPRDIWIASMRAKINTSYYYGNQKQENGGLVLSKSNVEEILGLPIQYAAVIDFNGFKKMIDILGGVEVEVEESFVDEKFPIAGRENDLCNGDKTYKCRYETLKFEKGLQTMDGETALKFVRSRHAQGSQGTDFSRSKRQQKIIMAILKKILTPKILFSPAKLSAVLNVFEETIEMDIESDAQIILARRLLEGRKNIETNVLPEDLLINPPISRLYDNQYVLIPKKGSWSDVRAWVKDLFQ